MSATFRYAQKVFFNRCAVLKQKSSDTAIAMALVSDRGAGQ